MKKLLTRFHYHKFNQEELDKIEKAGYEFINDGNYAVRYFCNNCRRFFTKRFKRGEMAPNDSVQCTYCEISDSVKVLS